MPNPARMTEADPDEFGAWLVVREITDEPTLALATRMFGESGRSVGEVRDWYRPGLVFALTDPAAPPAESVAAAVAFVPVGDDTVELSAVAVADDHSGTGLLRRLLEPVSHILAARGVARIVVRRLLAGPDARLGGVSLRPALVASDGHDRWSELDL